MITAQEIESLAEELADIFALERDGELSEAGDQKFDTVVRGLNHDEIEAVMARCVAITLDRPIELFRRNMELLFFRAAREVETLGESERGAALRQSAERWRSLSDDG
jgi:hypothetical protein